MRMERERSKPRDQSAAAAAGVDDRGTHERLELLALLEDEAKREGRRTVWDSIDREVVALVRRLLRVKDRGPQD
jgi:hypothetical protein